tara:strand:- start:86 stop:1027 length:942 start_codon:yes stop_codon:yes gene_type:complete
MINKPFNNIINTMSTLLSENKDKIITIAKKRAEEELAARIPTKEDLELQLRSIVAATLADPTGAIKSVPAVSSSDEFQKVLLKVEKVYNRFISILDKAIKKLEDSKKELMSVNDKLNLIKSKIEVLTGFTDILTPVFDIINTLKPTLKLALASQVSVPGAGGPVSGLTINDLGEKKKKIEDLLQKGKDSLSSIGNVSKFFNKEIEKISTPLNKGISGIDTAIQKLIDLRDQIIEVYTKFIESLIIPGLNDEDNDNELLGNKNLEDYLKDKKNLSTVLRDALTKGPAKRGDKDPSNPSDTIANSSPNLAFKGFN